MTGKAIRIGARQSKLAIMQAELVAAEIKKHNPEIEITFVGIKTTGDKILDKTLDKIGGKGLFVKELDHALRRGDVDICVHSYKDVPAEDNPELPIIAVSPREDPRDVLILPKEVFALNPAKPVGCSSKRRQAQFAEIYPGIDIQPVRGNVLTRLEKLDRDEFSALILAAAGIKRLELWERVSRVFDLTEMTPAVCQGILAVQGRAGEDYSYISEYNDADAWDASLAERAFIRRLGCGCGAPVGVFAQISGSALSLYGMIARDNAIHRDEVSGDRKNASELGAKLAQKMI